MNKTIKCLHCGNDIPYEEKDENFFGKCKECGKICALNKDYNDILDEMKIREDTSKIYEYVMIVAFFSGIASIAFRTWQTDILGVILIGICIAVEVAWKRYKATPPSTQKQYNSLRAKLRCNDAEGWYVLREEDRDVPRRATILAANE